MSDIWDFCVSASTNASMSYISNQSTIEEGHWNDAYQFSTMDGKVYNNFRWKAWLETLLIIDIGQMISCFTLNFLHDPHMHYKEIVFDWVNAVHSQQSLAPDKWSLNLENTCEQPWQNSQLETSMSVLDPVASSYLLVLLTKMFEAVEVDIIDLVGYCATLGFDSTRNIAAN